MILLLILLATEPPITLFAAVLLYVLSGPFLDLYALAAKKRNKKSREVAVKNDSSEKNA
jgi:CDP-diacylglycerol--serine O-phosphatidyltransferase